MLAKNLIAILEKNPELELGNVNISYWFHNDDEAMKKEIMIKFVNVFGAFRKSASGGTIDLHNDWLHNSDNLGVVLYQYAACKIIGKRIEKRTVKKPYPVPVEMVEVEESIEIPVTNCDIENGDVKEENVIFSEVTA